jgi:hypothetical protein
VPTGCSSRPTWPRATMVKRVVNTAPTAI